MSKKFLYINASGLPQEANAYETTDFATAGGAGNENKPILLNGAGELPLSMIPIGSIDHGSITGLGDDDHTIYILADGTRAFSAKQSYSSHPTFSADTELVDKKYVDDGIAAAITGFLTYKGVFDATTPSPDLNAQDNFKGDFYKVSVAGIFLGVDFNIGDHLVFNQDVPTATTLTSAHFDKVDNTESADLLREGDLLSGQIFLGDGTNIAQAVTPTGDVTISNTGVTAIATGVIVNADINAAAAIALSKLAPGSDGQIIVANGSGVPTYVGMSGDITIDNTGATAIGADKVKDTMIDFGTGAGQVSAADIPVEDSGAYTSQTNLEGVTQELYQLIRDQGQDYEVDTGGVTKGQPVYMSGVSVLTGINGKVAPYANLTVDERVVGIALETKTAGQTVKVLANDTSVAGLTFGGSPAVGDALYWDGTQHTTTIPSGAGSNVWQTGIRANTGVLHVETRFVKKNA